MGYRRLIRLLFPWFHDFGSHCRDRGPPTDSQGGPLSILIEANDGVFLNPFKRTLGAGEDAQIRSALSHPIALPNTKAKHTVFLVPFTSPAREGVD